MKPLISIVMAIYKPNVLFLEKQLESLNNQGYPNIELVICDDSATGIEQYKVLVEIIEEKITNFRWRMYKNEKNLGSNKTFEKLTLLAEGEYIAYCDQDDIWEPNKLEVLYESITQQKSTLAYSDLYIIDANDQVTHKSLKDLAPRLRHVQGDSLYKYFIKRNSVTGCALLVKSQIAKEAIPFLDGYIHDHWLALYASVKGSISYVPKALIGYRIHGNNQIGARRFGGINSKADYLRERLYKRKNTIQEVINRFHAYPEVIKVANCELKNIHHRIALFEKRSIFNLLRVVVECYQDPLTLITELILCFSICNLDKIFLKLIKRI